IQKANLNVLVDPNNGAGAIADPLLLDHLGVRYTILNGEPNGIFSHDSEPLEKNLSDTMNTMKNGDFDIGFVQDADADRLVILDETGRFIGEDYSLALSVDYVLSKAQNPKKVVVNLSTSKVIEYLTNKHHATLTYTKIGETNVTQGIKDHKATVGGEGNGGVIFPKVGWGRDSLVGIMLALSYLAESKQKVSEIVQSYPQYTLLREKCAVSNREEIATLLGKVREHYKNHPMNTEDGVKISFENAWIHIRPSNTEPIVRIFIESESSRQNQAYLQEVKQVCGV
ncbi:MAG: phosphoglucosamine mutase, partial [Candidatus Margulisbacteria bacterium]|nr:phosphoglucosamine mutase [Candidatus Margulisiibacteriota bacterium]